MILKQPFIYRKLTPSDSKAYRAIRLESLLTYPDSFGSSYQDQVQKDKLAFERYIEINAPNHFIVGAFDDHQLIGLCGFYRLENTPHKGDLIQLYVQPTYQGQQIGQHLLEATIEEIFQLEGLQQIDLQVKKHLQPAIRLYQKAGFQEVEQSDDLELIHMTLLRTAM